MPARRPLTNLRVRLFAALLSLRDLSVLEPLHGTGPSVRGRYSCQGSLRLPPRYEPRRGSIGAYVHGDWSGRVVSTSRGDWREGQKQTDCSNYKWLGGRVEVCL